MTNEEVINILEKCGNHGFGDHSYGGYVDTNTIIEILKNCEQVVRCKDCKYFCMLGKNRECRKGHSLLGRDERVWYCADGKVKSNE